MSLVFYYGSDFFSAKEAINKKIVSFLAKNSSGLIEKFDFDGGLEVLKNVLKRRSLFDQPELVMVYGYFSATELRKKNKEFFDFLVKKSEETKEFERAKVKEKPADNFALIDAIGARDIKKALIYLNQTLAEGGEPHAVLGQIIYQFRNLLKVKDVPAADLVKIGLHPFVARKTSQQVRRFELEELKRIYQRLTELDTKSKTGQIDLSAGLFQFLLEIS